MEVPKDSVASALPLLDSIAWSTSTTEGAALELLGAFSTDAEAAQDFDGFIKRNWGPVLTLALGSEWRTTYGSELTAMLALQTLIRPPAPTTTQPPQPRSTPPAPTFSASMPVPEAASAAPPLQMSPPVVSDAASPDEAAGEDGYAVRAFTVEAVDVDGKRRRLRRKRAASPVDIDDPVGLAPNSSAAVTQHPSPAAHTRPVGLAPATQEPHRPQTVDFGAPQGVGKPGSIMQRVIRQVSKLNISPGASPEKDGTLDDRGPHPHSPSPQPDRASPDSIKHRGATETALHVVAAADSPAGDVAGTPPQAKSNTKSTVPADTGAGGSPTVLHDGVASSLRLVQRLSHKMHAGLRLGDDSPAGGAEQGKSKKGGDDVASGATELEEVNAAAILALKQGLSAGVPATVLHTLLANSLADRTDVLGRSALHVATAGGAAPEAVRLLVGAGCDPNKPLSMDYRVLVTPRDPVINAPLPPRPQKRGRYALGGSIPAPRNSSLQHCSPLHLAAAGGHLDAVEALLGSPAIDVNARSADGATPLHLAAEAGQAAVAARLCRAAGVDVDAADSHGRTALHYAAAHGREFVVVELWARGARIDPADRYGWTPLHYAAREGYTEVAASLVIAGSQVQAGDGDGVTPAHLAAERGHVEVVDKLLMAGFVSDAGAGAGVTALHLAAAQGHGAVVHALLRAAAKPHLKDGDGCTAADVAARNGHFALVETLFKAGRGATVEEFFGPKITDEAGDVLENADGTVRVLTDPDILTDAEGVAVEDRTGLLHLLMHDDPGLPSAIVAAMKRGPITALDAVLPTPDGGWMSLAECAGAGGLTPLLRGLPDLFASPDVVTAALMAAVRQGREHTVHWILSTAASAHPGLDLPRTAAGALHVAAEAGDLDVLLVLLAAGFKAGGVDVMGRSSVAAAAAAVQEPAVLLLLDAARKEGAGEALDAGDEQAGGRTLLHHAVAHGMDELLQRLLSPSTSILNATDAQGRTPLLLAAKAGQWTHVRSLLEAGADPTLSDSSGFTPLHVVAERGDLAPFTLLYSATAPGLGPAAAASLLSAAIHGGSPEMVGLLLLAGHASPAACAGAGQYPVHLAAREGFVRVLQYLREAGFDMAARDGDGKTPLHYVPTGYGHLPPSAAVLRHEDYVAAAATLLSSGCGVDDVDGSGCTPLHIAAGCGSQDILLAFLDVANGCDRPDGIGWSPLFWACSEGRVYAAEALLDLGANPLAEDCNARTPLHFAAEGGHAGCVRLLVSRICHKGRRRRRQGGVHSRASKPDAPPVAPGTGSPGSLGSSEGDGRSEETDVITGSDSDEGSASDTLSEEQDAPGTPAAGHQSRAAAAAASDAATAPTPPVAKKDRAGINKPDQNGQTPLQLASEAGAVECVAALLDPDGSAEAKRLTALHLAVKQGLADVVQHLLASRRVHLSAKDVNGWTALHHVASSGNADIATMLLSVHADIDDAAADGDTPLHKAALAGHVDVARMLLRARGQVDARNASGSTPLYNAASQGHCGLILDLLEAGAAVDAATTSGCTPLYIAANNGWAEAVTLLLASADPDAELNNGSTALHAAAQNGHAPVVIKLLEARCDPDHEMHDGCTALHKASQAGHRECVEALIGAGADVDIPNNQGYTPLHMAASKGWVEIVEALLEAGADLHTERKGGWTAVQSAASGGYFDVVLKLAQHGAAWRRKGDADVVKLLSRKTTLKVSYIEGRLRIAEKERQRRSTRANGSADAEAPAAGAPPADLKKAAAEADAAMAALLQEENVAKEKAERTKAKKAAKKQKKAAEKKAAEVDVRKEDGDASSTPETKSPDPEPAEEEASVTPAAKAVATQARAANGTRRGAAADSPPANATKPLSPSSPARRTAPTRAAPPPSPPRAAHRREPVPVPVALVQSPVRGAKPPPPPPPPPAAPKPQQPASHTARPQPAKPAGTASKVHQQGQQPAMPLPTVRNSPWGGQKPYQPVVQQPVEQQAPEPAAPVMPPPPQQQQQQRSAAPQAQIQSQTQQHVGPRPAPWAGHQQQMPLGAMPNASAYSLQQAQAAAVHAQRGGVRPMPVPPPYHHAQHAQQHHAQRQGDPLPVMSPSQHLSSHMQMAAHQARQQAALGPQHPQHQGMGGPPALSPINHHPQQQQQQQQPHMHQHQQMHHPQQAQQQGVGPHGFVPLFGLSLPMVPGMTGKIDWSMPVAAAGPGQLFSGSLTSSGESDADELLNGIHSHVHRELSGQVLPSPPPQGGMVPKMGRPVADADGIDDLLGMQPWLQE